MSNNLTEYEKQTIEKLIEDLVDTQKLVKLYNEKYNELRSQLQEIFDKNDLKSFEAGSESTQYRATLVERVYVDYFIDMLKKKLSKEKRNKIIKKQYKISNIEKLIKLAKEYGIPKEEIKDIVDVEEYVDKEQIQQMSSTGDLSIEEIEGCYAARVQKHIQIAEKKKNK